MKCQLWKLLFILVLALSISCVSFYTFAMESDQSEIGQDSQTGTTAAASSGSDQEVEGADPLPIEPEMPIAVVQDEQIEFEYDEQEEYIPYNDYEYQTLLTLQSIEYQLKIIAGGVVLAACSVFIWYTILKPIKRFTQI